MQAYTITLPRQTPWEGQRTAQFVDHLLFTFDSLIFRIVAEPKQMTWQIVDLGSREPSVIEHAIRTSYPHASIQISEDAIFPASDLPLYRYVLKYQHGVPSYLAPILHVGDIKTPDPLAQITQAMSRLQTGERLIYTLIVVGFADYAYKEGEQQTIQKVYDGTFWGMLFPKKVERYVPELQRVLEDKLQQRLYQGFLFVQVDCPNPDRVTALSVLVDGQIVHFDRPHFNGLRAVQDTIKSSMVLVDNDDTNLDSSVLGLLIEFMRGEQAKPQIRQLRQQAKLILEPREIAALWHLPHTEFQASTIAWASSRQAELPQTMKGGAADGICLGQNVYAGQAQRVHLPQGDRATHCLIVGKTGTGKSNLLHHLIHQDIQAGRGVAVIDPHGNLVRDILRTSIGQREQDVVVLDLNQHEHPIPLNPLRDLKGEVAVERMVSILYTLYSDLADMPQTADALENALFTLQSDPQATLRDVGRLFNDEKYRHLLLAEQDDDVVEEFWQHEFESVSHQQQKQISLPVARRIRSFYRNKYVRAVLCHPDGLDFGTFIRQRKIILVSLNTSDDLIPEREQQLIGAFIIARLQMAAMSGAAQQSPFYLYIDEVQRFITSALERVFSEARKFNLSLTVANQYLKQLTGATAEAVMGNVGALIAFQTGDDDSRELAAYMKPQFSADDLMHLNKHEATVWMRYKGQQQPAFSLSPFTPLEAPTYAGEREQRIRRHSITTYTPKLRSDVLSWLEGRYKGESSESPTEDSAEAFYEPFD